MSTKTTRQSGFTLVELSLAMAILTFMLLVVSLAYINIARLYNASTAARNVQQNNRFAMEQISRVARNANSAEYTSEGGKTSLCLKATTGSTLFWLKNVDPQDPNKNELVQSASCEAPTASNSKTLTSTGSYAARLQADTSAGKTVTVSLWMVSKTDLLDSVDKNKLQCRGGRGSEFCAINKLTTTLELRGE